MPHSDGTPKLPVTPIAQRTVMPAWQVAELLGVPEGEVEAKYGDPVRVVQTLFDLTILPITASPEEG